MTLRELGTIEEFEACVRLQREIWRFNDADLVPRRMFVVAEKIGGEVLGAYDGGRLAGYTFALPGLKPGGRVYLHSHMLGVAPAYRNAGVGRELKLRQRANALARGIELIEWTFDPLEIKNAHFNITRLGAIARHYVPNQYGMSSSALQAGLPTDRLIAEWWLRAPATPRSRDARIEIRVDVPSAIQAWKAAGDPRAAETQTRNREALSQAFARGLAVIGYECQPSGGTFLLGPMPEERG